LEVGLAPEALDSARFQTILDLVFKAFTFSNSAKAEEQFEAEHEKRRESQKSFAATNRGDQLRPSQ